jgi:hypothetical protein
VIGLAIESWPAETRPRLASFERIRIGMTFEEVCASVGWPPGDYSRDHWTHAVRDREHYWIADDGLLFVQPDADDKVADLRVQPIFRDRRPTQVTRVLTRFGL